MKATVIKKHPLTNVLSASGIEFDGNFFFIVGDDSPYLYVLDKEFRLLKQEKLFDAEIKDSGRIKKKLKPDFEALTFANWKGKRRLLKFGSGSKKLREKLIVSDVTEGKVKEYSLKRFYKRLRDSSAISEDDFNVEAAVSVNQNIYLFNRGSNSVFKIAETELEAFIKEKSDELPSLQHVIFKLPVLDNVQAGFSGACVYNDKIFFSASLERTSNWIDDGEVLGSYIGYFDYNDLNKAKPHYTLLQEDNATFLGKVESIIIPGNTGSILQMIAVTDEDNGNSILLELLFEL